MKPIDPTRRSQEPSVTEVAALTRRLRELSAQGRGADPAERAAFQADKDALLARIAEAHDDTGRGVLPGDAAEQEFHRHRALTGRVEELPDEQRATLVDPADGPEAPEWMREQARRTEAEIATGNAPPSRPDNLDELAARVEALRARIAARDAGSPTAVRGVDPEQDARGDQLARWHHDDTAGHNDTAGDDEASDIGDGTGQGWSR